MSSSDSKSYQLVKVGDLICFVGDTQENWIETFAFFKELGIKIQARRFSDYGGKSITSDMIHYYANHPHECPAVVDVPWGW